MKKYKFQPNEVAGIKIPPPVESEEHIEAIKRISKKQIVELFQHEYKTTDICIRFNNALRERDRVDGFLEDNEDFVRLLKSSEVAKILNISHQFYNRRLKEFLTKKEGK